MNTTEPQTAAVRQRPFKLPAHLRMMAGAGQLSPNWSSEIRVLSAPAPPQYGRSVSQLYETRVVDNRGAFGSQTVCTVLVNASIFYVREI